MESLGYVFIYLLKGSLPWEGLKAKTQEEEENLILGMKQSAEGLFDEVPDELRQYFQHVRSSGKKMDYAYLRHLFHSLFLRRGWKYDQGFDWTVLKFLEQREDKPVE
jgi:hypothetical protein